MNHIDAPVKKVVLIPSRSQRLVNCPYCWTDQLASRNFCFRCSAKFIFMDEEKNVRNNLGGTE